MNWFKLNYPAARSYCRTHKLNMPYSRADLQGEEVREILLQMAWKNIRRYNRGEEE